MMSYGGGDILTQTWLPDQRFQTRTELFFIYYYYRVTLLEFALVSANAIKNYCTLGPNTWKIFGWWGGGGIHPPCMLGGGGDTPTIYAWGVLPLLLKVQSGAEVALHILYTTV